MKSRKLNKKMLLVLTLGVILAACASTGNPLGGTIPMDKEWHLSLLNGSELIPGSKIILRFYFGNEIGGNAGCNYFGGGYTSEDGSMHFSEVTSTMTACLEPEGLMDQESAYFEAFANTTAYRVEDERLELFDADGETILEFIMRPETEVDSLLANKSWKLISLDGSDLIEGTTITLEFSGEEISGSAGCNGYGGRLEAASEGILDAPEIMSTAMACPEPDGVMEQEQVYLQIMWDAQTYRFMDGELQIVTANGETLDFAPID
ncbi:MAG: META domain-containing protein [Chloroflexi bacterium]|nr:META domain-containing protein [Chloroflexota bacterium]